MKIYFGFIFILLIFSSGCKKDDITPPTDITPPGYQQDISWPSLADSPWPMHKGGPQGTGRSKYAGPKLGNTSWILVVDGTPAAISFTNSAIGEDSTIYFGSSYEWKTQSGPQFAYLYAVDPKGKVKWKFLLADDTSKTNYSSSWTETTPLVAKDGTIYMGSQNGVMYAVNKNGTLKWKYKASEMINFAGVNIGLDGKIYFCTGDDNLYSLNTDGSLNWKYFIDGGFASSVMDGLSFSPDGKTIYAAGDTYKGSKSLYAISVEGKVKWSFDAKATIAMTPIVDSYGNIYVCTQKKDEAVPYGLFCLDQTGYIKWNYKCSPTDYSEPALDKNGNLYFINEESKLTSVNYKGELRWAKDLVTSVISPLTCDNSGNIYFFSDRLNAFTSAGDIIFQLQKSDWYNSYVQPAINYNSNLYIGVNNTQKLLISIQ